MTTSKRVQLNVYPLLEIFLFSSAESAPNWLTYRHENARTGWTSEPLVAPLAYTNLCDYRRRNLLFWCWNLSA